jgi:uncharacterized protein YkwD
MTKNKIGKLNFELLLVITILIFFSGASGHTVAEEPSVLTTDAELEQEIAILMKQATDQRRSSLTYNPLLARVAREKAHDMGRRGYYDHETPEGLDHDDLIEQADYQSNGSGECIMADSKTAMEAWNEWMKSRPHRSILLGLDSNTFFASQVEYGVGHAYVPGSKWGHYWVVIIAAPKTRNSSSSPSTRPSTRGSSNVCVGSASPYPHVIETADGQLKPACGYVWVNDDDPENLRVKLMPGLIRTRDGNLLPATGYRWVRPEDSEDLRVEQIP